MTSQTSSRKTGHAMNNDSAAIATLNIRVTSIEGRVGELSSTVAGVQSALSTKIDSLATTLGGKIEERSRTPWQYIISGLAVAFSLYAYIDNSKIGPLKEKDADIVASQKELVATIRSEMVPARTHAREWQLNDDRFQRMEERIKFGEAGTLDRVRRLEDQYNNSFNLRDAIQQLDSRIQHFEKMSIERKGG